MGDVGSDVERLKSLTLDMLCSAAGSWHSFAEIEFDFRECDGEVDADALLVALKELISEGKIEHEERDCKDEYRWMPPQEGENLAEKLKRLEADIEGLRDALAVSERDANALMERLAEPAPSDEAAAERSVCVEQEKGGKAVSLKSTPDNFIVLARGLGDHDADIIAGSMQNILEGILSDHVAQLRAEQAADRAAVRALTLAMPVCWMPDCNRVATRQCGAVGADDIYCDKHDGGFKAEEIGDIGYAPEVRALQARMDTWPDESPPERVVDPIVDGNSLVRVDTEALWRAEEPVPFEPWQHPSPEVVERFATMLRDSGVQIGADSFKVGGTYAEQLGAPKGCNCTWHVQPTFVGEPVVHRGRGMMPCPVHGDIVRSVRFTSTCSIDGERDCALVGRARYVGEFGDIDEPSVGDVDGYGRRG